mmetsp:Transcript_16938/g.34960  ORF Transcript_16938/g.34960 Transcript_16938/m.34960 type:complete len:80 (-) Transcript_16938:34-273(-)
MTEWWPRGIETDGDLTAKPEKCQLAMEVTYDLHDADYALFASPNRGSSWRHGFIQTEKVMPWDISPEPKTRVTNLERVQ